MKLSLLFLAGCAATSALAAVVHRVEPRQTTNAVDILVELNSNIHNQLVPIENLPASTPAAVLAEDRASALVHIIDDINQATAELHSVGTQIELDQIVAALFAIIRTLGGPINSAWFLMEPEAQFDNSIIILFHLMEEITPNLSQTLTDSLPPTMPPLTLYLSNIGLTPAQLGF